jgi:hypothetical protein
MTKDETFMQFPYLFFSPVEIMVEETDQGVALIKGTLLVEGISRNGNLYTIDEMENIAEQAKGKPIYFGVKNGINPNTGLPARNLHDDSEPNKVGKILSATLDAVKRKIFFVAEVVNTTKFPDIIKKIRAGWGVSIGGFVTKAKYVLNEAKKVCLQIQNMVVEHVSLIDPSVIRGQDEAQVENVHVQECMIFENEPQLHITIKSGRGVRILGTRLKRE